MEFLADMNLLAIGGLWDKVTGPWAMNILFLVAVGFFVVWIGLKNLFKRKKDK